MKLIHAGKKRFSFRVGKREKGLLFGILQLYPLVPASHHQLTRGLAASRPEDEQLLEESLEEQRQANRKAVVAMLKGKGRLSETRSGIRLSLSHSEMEWLLQVLNDIRVGAWLALGEPDQNEISEVLESKLVLAAAMEVAGAFQWDLLAALGVQNPTQPGSS
jgi:hypothetical protein